jgi:hypothetical protein
LQKFLLHIGLLKAFLCCDYKWFQMDLFSMWSQKYHRPVSIKWAFF